MGDDMKRGNWTDNPCYYVSIVEGSKFGIVAGPFSTHREALDMVEPARKIGNENDRRGYLYTWGTTERENGYVEGSLNGYLGI